MKTVREVAAAVVLLQRELEALKREWTHCSICAEGFGCHAPFPRSNGITDPIHLIYKT